MPYINDVFISYKRGPINEQWLNEIFFPHFYDELNNALPYEPKIFVDKTGLTPGVSFEDELLTNLIFSKCLVSIWSPPYFRKSEWCIREFLTMRFKQEYHKLNEKTTPKTLVWPVLYREVNPLPAAVQKINYLDYTSYNVVGDAFFKSEKYLQLQLQLKKDIPTIVDIINNVPEYNYYWDTPEGRIEIVDALKSFFDNNDDFGKPFQSPVIWPK